MVEIEFHGEARFLGDCPAPYPAARAVPDWLKEMPTQAGEFSTVKLCPPFLQAITAGYIIPAPFDAEFLCDASGQLKLHAEMAWVEKHASEQYASAPFGGATVVKFRSPWVIRTPEGYSTLFTAPINRFQLPFSILTGMVETDRFYQQVNFPAINLLRPGATFTLRRGMPLVQVIPVRRDKWNSVTKAADEARMNENRAYTLSTPQAYKDRVWQKMEYR